MGDLTILLIEDDADDYVIVADLLREIPDRCCHLHWARTCKEGHEALATTAFDVCLLDYRLGTEDGITFLQERRRRGDATPVIFFTGHGGRDIDMEAMRAGADDYLAKDALDAPLLERSIRYAVERAQALSALRRSEERSRQIVQATPIPMVVARLEDARILFANAHFAALLGLDQQPKEDRCLVEFAAQLGGCDLDTVVRGEGVRTEVRGQRLDGTPFYAAVTSEPITFEGQGAVLIGFYDMTDQKRAEGELVRLERLRVQAEIAAGVSHNLNNLLVGVLGPAQALERKLEDAALREMAQDIVASARRARDLVRRLHHPGLRGDDEAPLEPVDLNATVTDAVRGARPRWKDDAEARGRAIEVVVDLAADVPAVRGTATGMHEILLNLLFNAVEALDAGGTITVRTRRLGLEAELSVADDGIGMDEETRFRAFEPLFTTKRTVDSGLGLYTVDTTVKRWGGRIELWSQPAAGSRFTIRLPCWQEPRHEAALAATPEGGAGHGGRLLVVDDDESYRQVLADLLRDGHEVETAVDVEAARTQFARGGFDAALIDLSLGGVPGNRLAQELRATEPALTTVLITGWAIPPTDPRAAGFDFVVSKPFTDPELLRHTVDRAVSLHRQRQAAAGVRKEAGL